MDRYTQPTEITYDQGSKILGKEFKNTLIKDKSIIHAKPVTSGNPKDNFIIEQINQVLLKSSRMLKLDKNCIYKDNPWKGIVAALDFAICAKFHITGVVKNQRKGKNPKHLLKGKERKKKLK